jgi:hypothetical protein
MLMNISRPQNANKLRTLLLKQEGNTLAKITASLTTNSERGLSTSAPAAPSNVLKGQHIRYIPKKRLRFNYNSPEGPLALVFHASDSFYKQANNWKLSTAVAMPAACMAYFTLGAQFWWAYPMLFLPSVFNLFDLAKLKLIVFKTWAYKLWLY